MAGCREAVVAVLLRMDEQISRLEKRVAVQDERRERVTFKTSRNIAVLGPESVLAIAAACPVAWHAAAIRFSAFTGLRLGELRALRWRDTPTR